MKITKEQFDEIFADIVSDEMFAQAEMNNLAGLKLVATIRALINTKLTKRLFEEDNEIEIITDKE